MFEGIGILSMLNGANCMRVCTPINNSRSEDSFPPEIQHVISELKSNGIEIGQIHSYSPEGIRTYDFAGNLVKNDPEKEKEDKVEEKEVQHHCSCGGNCGDHHNDSKENKLESLLVNINNSLELLNKNLMKIQEDEMKYRESIENATETLQPVQECTYVSDDLKHEIRKAIAEEVSVQLNAAYEEKFNSVTSRFEEINARYEEHLKQLTEYFNPGKKATKKSDK